MKKKIFNIEVFFDKNYMICPDIQLVANDYNSVELYFTFDRESGRKVFELKKPDGTVWVKEVEDNKIVLADIDEEGNLVSLINQAEKYEFEVCLYDENSKLTAYTTGKFKARSEVVNVDNDTVSKASELPILTQLIGQVDSAIKSTNTSASYAKTQGDYAKEQAQNVIDSNNQAASIINNFENNVDEYTDSFNQNATNKLNSYNSNANSKTTEYNTNSLNQTSLFNENATNKLNAYNANSEQKISAFNTNFENKTNDFDSHAAEKIEEYNQNTLAIENLIDSIVPKEKAEGQAIHINDALHYKFLNFEIEGNYKQKTTTGKNQFNAQGIIDKTNIVVDDNDVITISGISTSNGYCSTGAKLHELCPNLKVGDVAYLYLETDFEWDNRPGTLKNLIYIGENWISGNSKTITETLLNTTVIVYGGYNTTSTLKIMITKDNYDDVFEEYTNSYESPNPLHPQILDFINGNIYIKNVKSDAEEILVPVDLQNNPVRKMQNNIADKLFYDKTNKHLYLNKNIDKLILTGSENWNFNLETDSCYEYVCPVSVSAKTVDTLSTHFCNNSDCRIVILNQAFYLRIPKKLDINLSNVDKLKAWLSNNNVDVYYSLVEAQTINLGQYNLSTFEAENNISVVANIDSSNIIVEYALDIKKYIDEKILVQVQENNYGEM